MGNVQNLSGTAAAEKLKELAESKTCLFSTYEDGRIVSRPMATLKVDERGTMWFMSDKNSVKNEQVLSDNRVYLMYADTSKQHFLSVYGYAEIVFDRTKVDELWTPIAKAWFEQGKDDPDISIIKVKPQDGHYWDTKDGKLVSAVKIAIAAVTGKTNDDGGIDGDIKL